MAVTLNRILPVLLSHSGRKHYIINNSFTFCTYISNPHLSMAFRVPETIYVFPVESFWGWDLEQIRQFVSQANRLIYPISYC